MAGGIGMVLKYEIDRCRFKVKAIWIAVCFKAFEDL
jgi:hypothetical protein